MKVIIRYFPTPKMKFANQQQYHDFISGWITDLSVWAIWAMREDDVHVKLFYERQFKRGMSQFHRELADMNITFSTSERDPYSLTIRRPIVDPSPLDHTFAFTTSRNQEPTFPADFFSPIEPSRLFASDTESDTVVTQP